MCFAIPLFAANMNFFPRADKQILKKKVRKPSQCCCNSNKCLGLITAWKKQGEREYRVHTFSGAHLPVQVFLLWQFNAFITPAKPHTFQDKYRACAAFEKIMKVSTVAGNSISLNHIRSQLFKITNLFVVNI